MDVHVMEGTWWVGETEDLLAVEQFVLKKRGKKRGPASPVENYLKALKRGPPSSVDRLERGPHFFFH